MNISTSELMESFFPFPARRSFRMRAQEMATVETTNYFHFKAATGFGAIVDGSAPADSTDQVAGLLLRQGLIPVRIWPEPAPARRGPSAPLLLALGRYLLSRWRAAH